MRTKQSLGLGLVVMALVVVLCSANAAWGQEVTATITGMVTDQSGAPIMGADVVAKDTERGTVFTAQTNESGIYNVLRVPIGIYDVKVEAKGFQTALVPSVTLVLNQTARISVQMTVGQVTQTIEVSSEAPLLKTDSAEVSTIIDAATNEALPLASRNYVQLTLLSPGAVTPNPSSFNNGDNVNSGGRPYINGNREQSNNFLLDGMDNNQVSDNLLGYTPAPDAIQEFNLITQNASAEFGNFQGGVVSASIKSGTNQFHGAVWEFFRNDKLNANSWAHKINPQPINITPDNPQGFTPRDKLRWNMFGGTVGGPVLKNKLFFFFDYQGQRFNHPASQGPVTLFTAKERNGDFSEFCQTGFTGPGGTCLPAPAGSGLRAVQLYDPCNPGTGVPGVPCTAAANRQPFANNMIPLNRIDPVAQALFNSPLYPAPASSSFLNNAINTTSNNVNNNQYDIKVDYNISTKDRVNVRYSHAHQLNPSISSFKLFGNGYVEAAVFSDVVNWTHSINSNILNEFRIGTNYIRLRTGTTFDSSVGNFGTALGIAGANPAGLSGLLNLTFNTVTGIGNSEVTQRFPSTVIQVSDGVLITHGRHAFKTGFEIWRDRIDIFYSGNSGSLGAINFANAFTSTAGTAGTGGAAEADFFLGLPQKVARGVAGGGWGQRSTIFAGYVQDDWRIKNNLTFNLGLRYEAHTPWVEQSDRQANFGLFTGALELAGKNGNSRALYNGTYGLVDFQPRLGFAWTPGAVGGKTVVRGAFTISSYLEGTGTNLRLTLNPPFTTPEIITAYNNVSLPGSTTDQGIVGGLPGDPFAGANLRVWDPNFQPSVAKQWNLSIQRQLTRDTTVQVGYVGQYADHLANPMWLKQSQNPVVVATPDPANPGQFLYSVQTTPGPYLQGNPTLKADIGPISGTFSNAWMDYNSLQAVLQKRMGGGLQGQVAYTYSKCMTNSAGYYGTWGSSQASPGMPYWQNVYDGKSEKGPCFYDETHNLTSYVLYQLPFGHGKKFGNNMNKVANAAIGGWEVDGILTLHTGFALTVNNWGDPSDTGGWVSRPNCTGPVTYPKTVVSQANGGGIQWFDPSTFVNPNPTFTNAPQGRTPRFGNCGNGIVRGPGLKNFDMGLKKDFSFGETRKLQFRSEFLNLTNTKILTVPSEFADYSSTTNLGRITGSQSERNIQFALKLIF
ncbi:MAG TPA: carboxypeptidase-like regulatory domain-containing protein [Candidatus Dormibacteraeota bacterium]|nr:carboxypeptidase-like regulatory domain-containing protein [Candidatus Dormibacteraeota bacterium]